MYLRRECDAVIRQLADSQALAGCTVIRAYPYAKKPTRLNRPVIAVAPAALEAQRAGLGEARYFGDYDIQAEVHVPQCLGSPAARATAEQTVRALLPLAPAGIRISCIEREDALGCFRVTCAFTFRSEIAFEGGEDDGQG